MCGIAGIVGHGAGGRRAEVEAMNAAIAHRGPNADGIHSYPSCMLAHKRLAIVDLTPGGAQPMLSPGGSVAVTFNGEIYGYQELKKALSYPFQSQSDTEVILALYAKHGAGVAEFLPGMFAFALWDDTKQTLIAARDRFGEKPFYYALTDAGELIFASEIKAIIASGRMTPQIDSASLAHYLHKLYVHPTKTIYSNIHTLPPAHMLVFKNGVVEVSRYWSLPQTARAISLSDALPEFSRLLRDAVRKQLVADVPVGAFLSGGLDSTTIVALASEITPHIKTFAFGFNSSKNELSYAKMAADLYGTEHYELHDDEHNIAELLRTMATVYDEPFADSSNIPTYLISREARTHATVALSGDGADELLGGYGSYKAFLPQSLLAQLLVGFAQPVSHRDDNFFTRSEIATLLTKSFSLPDAPIFNNPDDAMRDDLVDYMPGDILVKTDRASMAHALELRAPFLDVPFAEFAASLPYSLKINKQSDKVILREAFGNKWPEPIRRRTKQGFGAPVDKWLQRDDVQKLMSEYLNNSHQKIFQHLSFDATRSYIARNDYKTWILLVLAMWAERN